MARFTSFHYIKVHFCLYSHVTTRQYLLIITGQNQLINKFETTTNQHLQHLLQNLQHKNNPCNVQSQ